LGPGSGSMTGSVGGFIDKDRPEEEAPRAP
jgi:hypothetical protein